MKLVFDTKVTLDRFIRHSGRGERSARGLSALGGAEAEAI